MSHDAHAPHHPHPAQTPQKWLRPMHARDPRETHRAATPLELMFDLCFVVAIAQVAARLHHAIAEHHVVAAIPAFGMVFFAIWWAWMNFTWFASAYDNDDAPYRINVLLQIGGVLCIAAGVPRAFDHADFTLVTIGYTVLRVGMIAQWLRAAKNHPSSRRTALRNAVGLGIVQLGWIGALFLPPGYWWVGALVLVPSEMFVPAFAERAGATPWHPHHIAERYGLLTVIVLGESVLAATLAIQAAEGIGFGFDLVALVLGGLITMFAMWWLYFDAPAQQFLSHSNRDAFIWGYGHIAIFASAAAVGAGLALTIDMLKHDHGAPGSHAISMTTAGLSVAVPVAAYLVSVALLVLRPLKRPRAYGVAFGVTAALVIAAAWTPCPILVIGGLMAALVTWTVRAAQRGVGGLEA